MTSQSLRKIGTLGATVLSLAGQVNAGELYDRLYTGAFNRAAKHKILDEKEDPRHDGIIYVHIDSDSRDPVDFAKDLVFNPGNYALELPENQRTDVLHEIMDRAEPDGIFLGIDVRGERATAVYERKPADIPGIVVADPVFSFFNYNRFNDLVERYGVDKNDEDSATFDTWETDNEEFNGLYRILTMSGSRFPSYRCPCEDIFPYEETARNYIDSLPEERREDLRIEKILNKGD